MKGTLSLLALSLVSVGFAIDGSTETVKPIELAIQKDTDMTNHGWISGYLQQQYFSSDKGGTNSGFFRNRRTRFAYNYIGDEKTMGRFSIEFASGANHSTAQVREAYVRYKPNTIKNPSGPSLTIGAQDIPIGYENTLSSSALLWSERTSYQAAFFNSEVSKGLLFQNGDANTFWYVGMFDSLTIGDGEQSDSTTKGEVMPVYGIRSKMGAFEGGLSGMYGNRPAYSAGAINLARTDRRFAYADLRYHPDGSKLDIRSEYMIGKDRIPLAAVAAANNVRGALVNAEYKLNSEDTVIGRWEMFDHNSDATSQTQTLWGLGAAKDVNKFMRLSLWADWNKVPTNSPSTQSYKQLTFRVQFKF